MTEPLAVGLRRIEVDLQGLRSFADSLRGDVDRSMRPVGDGIALDQSNGVPFGVTLRGSDVVRTAQDRYALCLASGREALESYIQAAEVLLAGALAVAERYGDADHLAAARASEVNAIFDEARKAYQASHRPEGESDSHA